MFAKAAETFYFIEGSFSFIFLLKHTNVQCFNLSRASVSYALAFKE